MKADAIVARLRFFLPAELREAQQRLARGNDPNVAVHEVRKSIKKLRAVLRLAADMAPERALAAVGAPLRKTAHVLGPLRDYLILGETGKRVARRDEEPPSLPPAPEAAPILKQARVSLLRAAGALRRLLQGGFAADGVQSGLRAIYQRARKEMRRAYRSKSDDDLHAWRRRAKDLFYVVERAEAPGTLVQKLQRLTQLLGDDHDLATFLAHHGTSPGKHAHAHAHLLKRAKRQRGPLQQEAFRLGTELFAEGAGAFVRRVMS